jgi:hypothetical protein
MEGFIIIYQRGEQYDCAGNCVPKTVAKMFPPETTLKEVSKWVIETAGVFNNIPNIIDNPKIIGIGNDN